MIESQPLFAFPETKRFVSLVKRSTVADGEIWDVVLDGTNTNVSFTQELMDELGTHSRLDLLEELVIALTEKLAEQNEILSDTEIHYLTKLMRCLT